MARGHIDLPAKTAPVILSKNALFESLRKIDADESAKKRVLDMETDFRARIGSHIDSLPASDAVLQKFNTSPFVLMFYSRQKGYKRVAEIEKDIIPAKVFSSMETSAGRMVETVVLPRYGWEAVPSTMHSSDSVLDGRKMLKRTGVFKAATLKSGPRCLNDEMAKDIGVDVLTHAPAWATNHSATSIDFTYGVLYGTKKQSNKKDWHILRNIAERVPAGAITSPCAGKWDIAYKSKGTLDVTATVRVGIEWWDYLGGKDTWIELCVSLIRACIDPTSGPKPTASYVIRDLADILDLKKLASDYNVALLQQSQYEWLLFLARHFCDGFAD